MKKIKYRLEYIAVLALIFVLNLIPYRLALLVGDVVGFLGFTIFRIRRKVTLDNLKESFKDQFSHKDCVRIGARSYRYIAKGMIELGLFPTLRKKNLQKFLTMQGMENLQKISGGGMLVTGHFGSWELMGAYVAAIGWPIDYLVGKQHNIQVDRVMNNHRQMFGVGLIDMGVAARGVIKAVRNGRTICIVSDQDAGSDGVIVEFLGRPASTSKGAAAFALKTGTPLVCCFIIREGFKQKIVIEPPIDFAPTGNKDEDIKQLTQAYTSLLEKYVREYPDHYFWPHRRWKSTS